MARKLDADWAFLKHLHDIGCRSLEQRLDKHFDDQDMGTTWMPQFVLSESLKPAHLPDGAKRKLAE